MIDTKELRQALGALQPEEVAELLDRLEAAEKDVALKERVIDALGSELNTVANKRDALRAKIEQMEKQEPVAEWTENRFHHYPQLVWNEKYKAAIGTKIYALPGAQPAPDVDALAQLIREIDGKHQLGAGALAERIVEWLAAAPEARQ